MFEKKYVLYGAGAYGKMALQLIGKENVAFFVDSDEKKCGSAVEEIPICSLDLAQDTLSRYQVVITVSDEYLEQIRALLEERQITGFQTFNEIKMILTRQKIEQRTDYIRTYQKAVRWILNNTMDGKAIICSSGTPKAYPEVTGYFIPTLLRWGYRDLAESFAKWLCSIQKEDGSWYDADDAAPYVFDTAQILKGLLAVRDFLPQADQHIQKGCDWILQQIEESGRLVTPTEDAWGGGICSELIHLYCLSPLAEAAEKLKKPAYREAAYKVLQYYKANENEKIMDFHMLSHFYAYIMEALLDMGERDLAEQAMQKVALTQKENGAVPAYPDVDWVCSTGMFQFALVWFRLGMAEYAQKAFAYACKLQNESGGWYGSYLSELNAREDNFYFPAEEISWAVKYFLDALFYKHLYEFEKTADLFAEEIGKDDERYQIVRKHVSALSGQAAVLDIGCGKGRYLKNLLADVPGCQYYAVDLSQRVMHKIADPVIKKQGSLTMIPYENDFFDLVYTCEALEHAVDIRSAVRELARVTKKGGKIIIIDKSNAQLGALEIGEWEQWFDEEQLKAFMEEVCSDVQVAEDVGYEDHRVRGLFSSWIGVAK